MTDSSKYSQYLNLSRGQWDENLPRERIQQAIDDFYVWYEKLLAEGRVLPGQRLAEPKKWVSKDGITDGPFAETKEVIGGYWFFCAESLEDAAALAAQNPCVACGLIMEVRPVEEERCSAFDVTSETPLKWRESKQGSG